MKFSTYNLGCKVNAYECESVASSLEKDGWIRVGFEEDSDVAIIFTCAVTNIAAQKSRKALHKIKRNNKNCITCMVGCYSQLDDGMIDEAEIIVGTAHKIDIPKYINEYLNTKERIRVIEDLDNTTFDNLSFENFSSKARAFLKIQDGCNQFCSYCVIPYVRGRERSMNEDDVISNIKKIEESYPEVVLTGIHTGRYGNKRGDFTKLIKRILDETNISRIRISSIEITEVTDELIELIKNNDRLAKHLHIPLQSCSDKILKLMNRPYMTSYYYDIITKIRKEIDNISISCDIIVGFPSESESDFIDSYNFLKKCNFSFLHVFPYSARKGTKAAEMAEQVTSSIKKDRVRACTNLSKDLLSDYSLNNLGKEEIMVCEEYIDGYTRGYTSNYLQVYVEGEYPHKEMLKIKMNDYKNNKIYAKKVDV